MNTSDEKQIRAVEMLKSKYEESGRLPVKDDFEPADISFIKAKLGPWPRALEAAGLKEASGKSSAEKSREKRARSKKNLRMAKKAEKDSV